MPAMTIANQITFAKRFANIYGDSAVTNTSTDDVVRQYLNTGVEEFCKTALAITKENYLTVTPKFDLRDNWYVNVTITGGTNALAATDVAITATDASDVSGTAVATAFEATLQAAIGGGATATVAWDDATWTFEIDASDSDSIKFTSPSGDNNIDALLMIFGAGGTQTGTTWTSGFPQDCTVKTDLPSDYLSMEHVDYDQHILYEFPTKYFMSPETSSNWPEYYSIRNRVLQIAPSPNTRRLLKIRYRSIPNPVTLTGEQDATTCALPTEVNMAPVYYAAGLMLKERFEHTEGDKMLGQFQVMAQEYRRRESNQNVKMYPRNSIFYVPRVDTSTL